jgi:3-hydroxybutyrate dehydrogenase
MTMLEERVAIVTGAAGGLGRTVCDVFEHEGAKVVRVDVAGDGCLHLDVGTADGNRAMVEAAVDRHGRLDVLVLNAGTQFVAPLPEFPEEEWDRLFDVMAKGPFLAMKYAWPTLTERPGSRIVVTASGSSYIAESYKSAYVAAKHAVLGLVKVAALEGGPAGLTANAVGPGWMRTPMVEGQLGEQMRLHRLTRDEVIQTMVARHPVKRFVETEEVANTIAFLASARSSGINGSFIPVDLGTLAC